MDWQNCLSNRTAKPVKLDKNKIMSIRKVAKIKIKSANILTPDLYIAKISLLYDALREYLECVALEKGYKIYNHECYTSFISEVLNMSRDASIFDKLRIIRNGINYYGKDVTLEEANKIIEDLKNLIKKFEN